MIYRLNAIFASWESALGSVLTEKKWLWREEWRQPMTEVKAQAVSMGFVTEKFLG